MPWVTSSWGSFVGSGAVALLDEVRFGGILLHQGKNATIVPSISILVSKKRSTN